MIKSIVIVVLLITAVACLAQTAPTIEWARCLGGIDYDEASSIAQTADGGFIVAGESSSNDGDVSGHHGDDDYWVVKLNSSGEVQWQKCLGGSSGDVAYSIEQTLDGGFIVAGESRSNDGDVSGNHGGNDYWVVKLNSSGEVQWQKCLGGSSGDVASSIAQTADGGFIVAGESRSNDGDVSGNHGYFDYWIVKLNSLGEIQWQKCLGGSSSDFAYSIAQTADGGFIVAGYSESNDGDVSGNHGIWDYWVVKLNSLGEIQWQKCLGGSDWDCAHSVAQTADGGFIVAGYSKSNDGDVSGNHGFVDYWVVKLNSLGEIQWQKCLGGSDVDWATFIAQTADGGFIVAGYSSSNDGDVSGNHGNWDYWVVKLNSSGVLQWQKSLGGSSSDVAISIAQTADGGYIVAGYSESNDGDVSGNHGGRDYWIVKLSPEGTGTEELTITSPMTFDTFFYSGTTLDITWSSSAIDSVNIEYSTNNGVTWISPPIAENYPASIGLYSWTAPEVDSTLSHCKIRICDSEDSDPCDISEVFSIIYVTSEELLARIYSPELFFHPDELFFPLNAQLLWDNSSEDSEGEVDFLNCSFGSDQTAGLQIQELAGGNWTVFYRCDESSGDVWIQYWLYYSYNYYLDGVGDHLSDWEVITLTWESETIEDLIAEPRRPDCVTVSAHFFKVNHGEGREPDFIGNHPTIYIAEGTHAMAFHVPLDGPMEWSNYALTDFGVMGKNAVEGLVIGALTGVSCLSAGLTAAEFGATAGAVVGTALLSWSGPFAGVGFIGGAVIGALVSGGLTFFTCMDLMNEIRENIDGIFSPLTSDNFSNLGGHLYPTDYILLSYEEQSWHDYNGRWGPPPIIEEYPIACPKTPYHQGVKYDDPVIWANNFGLLVGGYVILESSYSGRRTSVISDFDVTIQDRFGRVAGFDTIDDTCWNFIPGAISIDDKVIITEYALELASEEGILVRGEGCIDGTTSLRLFNHFGDTMTIEGPTSEGMFVFWRLNTDSLGEVFSIEPMPIIVTDTTAPTINIYPTGGSIYDTSTIFADLSDDLSGLDISTCVMSLDGEVQHFFYAFDSSRVYMMFDSISDGLHNISVRIKDFAGNEASTSLYLLGIEQCQTAKLPEKLQLLVIPNPFNSSVSITSPKSAKVEIYDVLGQSVDKLSGGEQVWKPQASVGSGIYLVRATVGEEEITKRVVYLK